MKKIAKISIFIIIAIALVFGVIYYLNMPLAIETVKITSQDVMLYFTEQGFVKNSDKMNVYAPVADKVLSVETELNKSVKAGDVICVIDDTSLQYEKIRLGTEISGYKAQISNIALEEKKQKDSMEFDIKSLKSEYNALNAQQSTETISKDEQLRLQNIIIEQNKNDYALAEDNLKKFAYLKENGLISDKEYNDIKNAEEEAKSRLSQSVQQLSVIETGGAVNDNKYYEEMKASLGEKIKGMESAMAKSYTAGQNAYYKALISSSEAEIELINKKIEDCIVKAPVDGIITGLNAKNANITNTQEPVATISGKSLNEIETFISTSYRDDINLGDNVIITAKRQKGDVDFDGVITFIDSEAVVKVSPLGVEERKVKVIVSVNSNAPVTLDSGFDVSIKFITLFEKGKISAPKTAVFKNTETNSDNVWVVNDGKAELRQVELGTELRTGFIVNNGLEDGSVVIKDANDKAIKEGVRINGK